MATGWSWHEVMCIVLLFLTKILHIIIKNTIVITIMTPIILDVCRYYRREEREEEAKVGSKDDSDEEEGGK